MQRYFSLSNKVIEISNDDIYHILKVMRGKVGDRFEVVKNNNVIVCEITSTSPFEIREIETLSSQSELNKDITLFYCLAKGDKNDLVIQNKHSRSKFDFHSAFLKICDYEDLDEDSNLVKNRKT